MKREKNQRSSLATIRGKTGAGTSPLTGSIGRNTVRRVSRFGADAHSVYCGVRGLRFATGRRDTQLMFGLSEQSRESRAAFVAHVKLQHRSIVRNVPFHEEGVFLHRRVSGEWPRNAVVRSVTVQKRRGGVYPREVPIQMLPKLIDAVSTRSAGTPNSRENWDGVGRIGKWARYREIARPSGYVADMRRRPTTRCGPPCGYCDPPQPADC